MPRKDPERQREYDQRRRAKINADPELLHAKRQRNAEYVRERLRTDERFKLKTRAHAKAWSQANGEDYRLRKRFGISKRDREAMLESQGGCCAICREPEREGQKLGVDHDHSTGVVRGLLCFACNSAIGKLKDDPAVIDAAAAYLRRFK